MPAELFGIEHILYIIISTIICSLFVILSYKFTKKESTKVILLKIVGIILFISIMMNRLSQVFRYSDTRWYLIIPDSYCGMTSLVLSLAVIFGKKNNCVLHFTWLLGIFGGISTVIYATFVDQGPTIFYLPTISGLLHHSFSATLVVMLLLFKQIDITYKKWYYSLFGFTCYLTVGAFLMGVFKMSDAFHIVEPLIPDTVLTTWVMAPMYAVGYGFILFIVEILKKKKKIILIRKRLNMDKPKHFLLFKILGFVFLFIAGFGFYKFFTGFGDFESNNFMIGMFLGPIGIFLTFVFLSIGFRPELSKLSTKSVKYIQEENKEDLRDIVNTNAQITKDAVTTTVQAVKEGLEDQIYCKYCGNKIDKDSAFCKHCGKKL